MAEMSPQDELRIFYQHLRRPLLTDDGRSLIEHLEHRFCERREIVSEQTPSGAVNQYLGRQSSFVPGDPYATAFNEGRREVVLYLKTLMEMSE